MSGITKLMTLTTLMVFSTLSLSAADVEKSAKSRMIQATDKSKVSIGMSEKKKSVRSEGSSSVPTIERRSAYKDVSEPGLIMQKQLIEKQSALAKGHKKIRVRIRTVFITGILKIKIS